MKAETSSLHCESVPLQNDKPGTATFGALSCSYFCILSHFFDLKKSQPLGTKPIQEIYMASLFTCGYLLHSLLQALFNNSFLFCSEKHRCYGRDISRRDCTKPPLTSGLRNWDSVPACAIDLCKWLQCWAPHPTQVHAIFLMLWIIAKKGPNQ